MDGLHNVRQNGVIGIVHSPFGDALKGELEDLLLDLFLVVSISLIDRVEGFGQHFVDDLGVVVGFEGLGLFEDVLCPFVKVVLEGDLLVDEELQLRNGLR